MKRSENFDTRALRFINGFCVNPVFDALAAFFHKFKWYHLLMIIPVGLPLFFAHQPAWRWSLELLAAIAVGITISDLGTFGIRRIVKRPRPGDAVKGLRLIRGAGHDKFSFPSSHAANTVCVATISALVNPLYALGLIILALFICYSRIYLGKHYPLDVLCGALLGAGVGTGMYFLLMFVFALIK